MGWLDKLSDWIDPFVEAVNKGAYAVFTGLGIPKEPPSVFTLPIYEKDIKEICIPTIGWIDYSKWTWGKISYQRAQYWLHRLDKEGKRVIFYPEAPGEVRKDERGIYYWTYSYPKYLKFAEYILEEKRELVTLGLVSLIAFLSIKRG